MKQNAYKDAGVDVEAGAALIERIKPHVAKTKRSGVMSGLGGFGALFDLKETGYKDPLLVSATDGVGTKLKIAIDSNIHDTVGIDAVAMCVNDLIVQGAEPLFFLDYFATGKLDNDVAEAVIKGIAKGCEESGCALIGGETAEMPGMYAPGDYDIAGFCVGAVERADVITGDRIADGDVILGLRSSGVHSNGFSLVRKLVASAEGFDFETPAPFDTDKTLGALLLEPTRLYVQQVLKALKVRDAEGLTAIKGMVHVTGGGFYENVPRILPDGMGAEIDCTSWELPALFQWLRSVGALTPEDLAGTFNCGIGYMIVCAPENAEEIKASLLQSGEEAVEIGRIVQGAEERVTMHNIEQCWGT